MSWKSILGKTALGFCLATAAWSGTFGNVVVLGGHPADLAVDESRGLVYVANFTANRIDVVSMATQKLQTSWNVAARPSSLALSPDSRYLVVTHYSKFESGASVNGVTVIHLASGNTRRSFALSNPPLGVAFGYDNKALIATTQEIFLFDPSVGTTELITTVPEIPVKALPVPPAARPSEITMASMVSSRDYRVIHAVTDTLLFTYNSVYKTIIGTLYEATPPLGPRTISTNRDGSLYLAGWAMFDSEGILHQFADVDGNNVYGGHVFDPGRGVIYAQIPPSRSTEIPRGNPVLQIVADDNLATIESLKLKEYITGKMALTSDGMTAYALSDSGLLILPVGRLNEMPRVAASQESLLFRSNSCERNIQTQEITIFNPGGGAVDFTIASDSPGVTVSPTTGLTPATVRISVDPGYFQNRQGTSAVTLTLTSQAAINIPKSVRVLVNTADPDQRGTIVHVPGRLVDLLADPLRPRVYLLRQDTNEVLVYDTRNYTQIARLRTGNTPTHMTLTLDRRYLLVGHENSQIASVFDLEALEPSRWIRFPAGHYPRSLAAAGNTILAACRSMEEPHVLDWVDFSARRAKQFSSLGIWQNQLGLDIRLVPSANGASVAVVQSDGHLWLYDSSAGTFTISRQDTLSLTGPYGASNFGVFAIGNTLYNGSLVPAGTLTDSVGTPSGVEFYDLMALRTGAPAQDQPGLIERLDLTSMQSMRPVRMAEAPLLNTPDLPLTRTLGIAYDRSAIINLTVSGITVLSWDYDAAVQAPRIDRVVNAADFSAPVAPGGLISIFGSALSPINLATKQIPLPTALANTCLKVNGLPVPMLYVSPNQINAQLPVQSMGNTTMVLHTPAGVSDNYYFTILPTAPGVFRVPAGSGTAWVPAVVRAENEQLVTPSNPIQAKEGKDIIVIYFTGGGKTTPEVAPGEAAPSEPVATTVTAPRVEIGGVPLEVQFSGLTPGSVGLYQINARVPANVPRGISQELRITQGSISTTVNVRVVD